MQCFCIGSAQPTLMRPIKALKFLLSHNNFRTPPNMNIHRLKTYQSLCVPIYLVDRTKFVNMYKQLQVFVNFCRYLQTFTDTLESSPYFTPLTTIEISFIYFCFKQSNVDYTAVLFIQQYNISHYYIKHYFECTVVHIIQFFFHYSTIFALAKKYSFHATKAFQSEIIIFFIRQNQYFIILDWFIIRSTKVNLFFGSILYFRNMVFTYLLSFKNQTSVYLNKL